MKRNCQDCNSNAQDFPEVKISKHEENHTSPEQSRFEDIDVENLFQMNLDHMKPLANDLADPQLVHKLQRENEQLQEENVQLKRKLNDENLFQMNLDHMQPLPYDLADPQVVQKLQRENVQLREENEQLKRKLNDWKELYESLRSRLASRGIDQIQSVLSLPEPMKEIKGFHCVEYFSEALGWKWKSKKDIEHFMSTESKEMYTKIESIVTTKFKRSESNSSTVIKLQVDNCSTISISELRFANKKLKEELNQLQDKVQEMKNLIDENLSRADEGCHDHPYLVEVSYSQRHFFSQFLIVLFKLAKN